MVEEQPQTETPKGARLEETAVRGGRMLSWILSLRQRVAFSCAGLCGGLLPLLSGLSSRFMPYSGFMRSYIPRACISWAAESQALSFIRSILCGRLTEWAFICKQFLQDVPQVTVLCICGVMTTLSLTSGSSFESIIFLPLTPSSVDGRIDTLLETATLTKKMSDTRDTMHSLPHPPLEMGGMNPGFAGVFMTLPHRMTGEALQEVLPWLPIEVGFLLDPNMLHLEAVTALLHQKKRPLMLMLPLEPQDFPETDYGPFMLLTGLSDHDNNLRLSGILKRVPQITYVYPVPYAAFLQYPHKIHSLMQTLKQEGKIIVLPMNSPDCLFLKTAIGLTLPSSFIDYDLTSSRHDCPLEMGLEGVNRFLKMGSGLILMPFHVKTREIANKWLASLPTQGITLLSPDALMRKRASQNAAVQENEKEAKNG